MAEGEGSIALVAGASGLTGGFTLDALLAAPDVSRVIAVTRRPLGREHSRLANRIVQFERLEAQLKGTACEAAATVGLLSGDAGARPMACRDRRTGRRRLVQLVSLDSEGGLR